MHYTLIESPVGPLLAVAVDGALVGLYFAGAAHAPRPAANWHRVDPPAAKGDGSVDHAVLHATRQQLQEYFARGRQQFALPLRPVGTPFQSRVWQTLQDIPYGHTTNYGAMAVRLGQPGAARAVGAANARNPISIIIPCHRAIGGDGRLNGYAGGVERKAALLALEGSWPKTGP
jgi:methylated-DNA-[protein]-cysteine S-methyltransferase